ncbi:terminase large subunit domain-containing protein [Chloroflexota bacterium]
MLAIDLRYALDPVYFAGNALNFNPDPWQEWALRWSGRRLLLNCCRQSGKSTTAAILGLHRALFYPGSLVLLVSPSLRQSSEPFRKVSDHLDRLDLPPRKVEDNRLSVTFANNSRIVSLPSTESTIRGFSGASLIIEDEAARVPDELYIAIRPMLAVSAGRLILMSTPFGKRGHFFKEFSEGGSDWERIKITATECPRISEEFLLEEKTSLGDWWFRQEYMCEFVETVDQVFTYDSVMNAITDEVKPLFGGVR